MDKLKIIETLEAELRQAQLAGDVAALDRLLADELVFTGLDGALVGKAGDLSLHRSGQLKINKLEPLEQTMVDLGDTVVVNVAMAAQATVFGAPDAGILRYTRIWHRRPQGWQVVAGHLSRVQAGSAALTDPPGP